MGASFFYDVPRPLPSRALKLEMKLLKLLADGGDLALRTTASPPLQSKISGNDHLAEDYGSLGRPLLNTKYYLTSYTFEIFGGLPSFGQQRADYPKKRTKRGGKDGDNDL